MKFGNPHLLWLLFTILAVIFLYVWSFAHKRKLLHLFVTPLLGERLLMGVSFTRQKLKVGMIVLALFSLILSMSAPKWGFHWEDVKRRGVDIVVALDLSKSMMAQDVSPNRLERAKMEIKDLLQMVQGDRIGLVAFSGVSFLQVPLTLDYGAVQIFLSDLDTELIPVPGTAIADAIHQSIKAFDKADKKSRVLILITDGEDHLGNPIEAAAKAKEEGIKIYTIGIGQEGGAPIPEGEQGGFKKDARGEMILTKMNEEVLQKIALNTGGSYIRSVTGDLDLEKIYQDIHKSVEDKELKSGKQKRFEERFQWPLALAFLLLILEFLFSERKRTTPLRLSWPWRKGVKNLVIAFGVGAICMELALATPFGGKTKDGEKLYQTEKYQESLQAYTDAQIDSPKDERIKYNMANNYYKMGQHDEAQKLFEALTKSTDTKMAQKSFYNLGNTAYRQGRLKESVEAYQEALKLDPTDEDAKFNLEFVREEIKRRLEENKKQQQQQQQQQNKQCDNPSGQSGDQNKDQQKSDQQKQDQQKQDQQKQEQQKSAVAAAAPTPIPTPTPTPSNDGKGEDEKKKEEAAKAQQSTAKGGAPKAGTPTPEEMQEAMRWLSNLEENKKKYNKMQVPQGRRYEVEKDW